MITKNRAMTCLALCAVAAGCAAPAAESAFDSGRAETAASFAAAGEAPPSIQPAARQSTATASPEQLKLLRQKVALCEQALELGKRRVANLNSLHDAGRLSTDAMGAARAQVIEREIGLIDARLELARATAGQR